MSEKGIMMPVKQEEDSNEDAMIVRAEEVGGETTGFRENDDEPVVMEVLKGEIQPPAFRDGFFAMLFFIQVAAVAGTAVVFGSALINSGAKQAATDEENTSVTPDADDTVNDAGNNNNNLDGDASSSSSNLSFSDVMYFVIGSFLAASLVSMSAFRVMIRYPLTMIQVSFFIAPVTFGFVAMLILSASKPTPGDPDGDVHNSIVGFWWGCVAFVSLISLCFYRCYARFMPFAAVNLKVALSAVRANMGLFFLSVGSLFATYAWSFLWLVAFAGIIYHDQQKPQVPCSQESGQYDPSNTTTNDVDMCDQGPSALALVALLLCLYWTQQVIQNTLHTTTAGAVSSWWILPTEDEAAAGAANRGGCCCGPDVSDALHRSCTYSFGSICFGSLLVAILQTLEQVARQTRNRRDIVSCVIQCIVICLRSYMEYFNSWAFCYVGIYGYDYISAGRKVIELFKARGWTTLITDRLVFRVLLFVNLGVAALTGGMSVLIIVFVGYSRFDNADDWNVALQAAFWFGFIIGLIVSSTVLFVVESAVRTIMVCFAEQPGEGGGPTILMQELRHTYNSTYPNVFVFRHVPGDNGSELHNRSGQQVV